MSFFGKLFATEKSLNDIVTGVSKGLDALVYTDEEKAADAAKDRAKARQKVVEWISSTQGQNLSRRLIALSITAVWLFMYLVSTFASMFFVLLGNEKINAISEIAHKSANDMSSAVMLILTFYFAAPHLGEVAKAMSNKFIK